MNENGELEAFEVKLVEELIQWGAATGFEYVDWPGGRSYYLELTEQPPLEIPAEQLAPVLYAVRAGWLTARAGGLPEVGPGERDAIDEGASSVRHNRNLRRIRAAGGALAEQLEAAARVKNEAREALEGAYSSRDPEYWVHVRELGAQFDATVERLAAQLEG